jgi:hypothetical protein
MKEEYWAQKDGKKIAVGNMSLTHLQNLLRKLIREDRIIFRKEDNDLEIGVGLSEWWKE